MPQIKQMATLRIAGPEKYFYCVTYSYKFYGINGIKKIIFEEGTHNKTSPKNRVELKLNFCQPLNVFLFS